LIERIFILKYLSKNYEVSITVNLKNEKSLKQFEKDTGIYKKYKSIW